MLPCSPAHKPRRPVHGRGLLQFNFLCSHASGQPRALDDSLDAGWFARVIALQLVTQPAEHPRLVDRLTVAAPAQLVPHGDLARPPPAAQVAYAVALQETALDQPATSRPARHLAFGPPQQDVALIAQLVGQEAGLLRAGALVGVRQRPITGFDPLPRTLDSLAFGEVAALVVGQREQAEPWNHTGDGRPIYQAVTGRPTPDNPTVPHDDVRDRGIVVLTSGRAPLQCSLDPRGGKAVRPLDQRTMQKDNLVAAPADVHGRISKQTVALEGVTLTRVTFAPGARWFIDLKLRVGTELCDCLMWRWSTSGTRTWRCSSSDLSGALG
jgi:hypothetical protein